MLKPLLFPSGVAFSATAMAVLPIIIYQMVRQALNTSTNWGKVRNA